jgi:hypothetical protein
MMTSTANSTKPTVVKTDDLVIGAPATVAEDESGGGFIVRTEEGETLHSVLGYFIFIFFSVLVVIMIDNRNLERRYERLLADYKNKDSEE